MALVRDDIELVLYVSGVTFLIPVSIFCKFVFIQLTKRKFNFTNGDFLDIAIFGLVAWLWFVVEGYESSDVKVPIFGPE